MNCVEDPVLNECFRTIQSEYKAATEKALNALGALVDEYREHQNGDLVWILWGEGSKRVMQAKVLNCKFYCPGGEEHMLQSNNRVDLVYMVKPTEFGESSRAQQTYLPHQIYRTEQQAKKVLYPL